MIFCLRSWENWNFLKEVWTLLSDEDAWVIDDVVGGAWRPIDWTSPQLWGFTNSTLALIQRCYQTSLSNLKIPPALYTGSSFRISHWNDDSSRWKDLQSPDLSFGLTRSWRRTNQPILYSKAVQSLRKVSRVKMSSGSYSIRLRDRCHGTIPPHDIPYIIPDYAQCLRVYIWWTIWWMVEFFIEGIMRSSNSTWRRPSSWQNFSGGLSCRWRTLFELKWIVIYKTPIDQELKISAPASSREGGKKSINSDLSKIRLDSGICIWSVSNK